MSRTGRTILTGSIGAEILFVGMLLVTGLSVGIALVMGTVAMLAFGIVLGAEEL